MVVGLAIFGCSSPRTSVDAPPADAAAPATAVGIAFEHGASPEALALVSAAEAQVGKTLHYDPAYVKLDYPGGDVALERGVCTDVVIRAMRELDVDLQVELHQDMSANFDDYPRNWGLARPDSNIDHRRVPNLQTYFRRTGKSLVVSGRPEDYWPGDIVSWDVQGRPHSGIVSTKPAPSGERYCIVHNIGAGTRVEDRLFDFRITGHYRPFSDASLTLPSGSGQVACRMRPPPSALARYMRSSA
ncbi:MAG: DUF1287 domain-containing protein [Actinobacteria bacterium]|nr:DUF1287 domain-containing protein [Actinomycetota bacterium]